MTASNTPPNYLLSPLTRPDTPAQPEQSTQSKQSVQSVQPVHRLHSQHSWQPTQSEEPKQSTHAVQFRHERQSTQSRQFLSPASMAAAASRDPQRAMDARLLFASTMYAPSKDRTNSVMAGLRQV
jgi:FtsZ-interacting cell division protein ZipA